MSRGPGEGRHGEVDASVWGPQATPVVERWSPEHPRFAELLDVVAGEQQTRYLGFAADWHLSSHVLVALDGTEVVGFLRFVVQHIGTDDDLPPVRLRGEALTEAKVIAFGVVPRARRRGFGTELQRAALAWATELGCFQVRSRSDGDRPENHELKLKMGFGVHPAPRGDDTASVYFVMPLRAPRGRHGAG